MSVARDSRNKKRVDLEGTLWRLEYRESIQGEREEFYRIVYDMWKSGQIDDARIQELAGRYQRFRGFLFSGS